jgi:tetratricopeptide (TPR) repeat protein
MRELDLKSLFGLRPSARRPHKDQLNLTAVSVAPQPVRRQRRTRRLNLAFLSCLLAVVAVLGVSVHFVHAYQLRRHASALLDRARRAEAAEDLGTAVAALRHYLNVHRADGPAWAWYARLVDQRTPKGPGRVQVYLVHEEALRHDPDDPALERRCAELALQLGRPGDARRHFTRLNERGRKDSGGAPADAALEDLLGQCDQEESKFPEAAENFRKAIAHDPGQIASYDRLARLLRLKLKQAEKADQWIEGMIQANPKSARAYLTRWRYRSEFRPATDPRDLEQALQLAPEDPEVLLATAGVSEQRGHLAAARKHLEKGLKLAPGNIDFPRRLAQVELRDGHPERAEAVLRAAVAGNPEELELWYLLADLLISQGKIDGKDQAADYLGRLRNRSVREGYLQYLEAGILLQRQRWPEAVAKIHTARSLLAADPSMMARLNWMLAQCYGRLGVNEQRLAALEQVTGDETTGVAAGLARADALARSGKLDEAMKIQSQVVERLRQLVERLPELRLDLVRLLIEKALRQPSEQRDWREAERQLEQAEEALPGQRQELTVLRADLLLAQGRPDEAVSLVETARTKEPRNVRYRVALSKIAGSRKQNARAIEILDQAEKELGPDLDLRLARLDVWVRRGGAEAEPALAELARTSTQLPRADQPAFLEPLAVAAFRLGAIPLARESLRKLLVLQPDNLQVLLGLLDLAVEADDPAEVAELVGQIRRVEGEDGTLWRFGEAVALIHQTRRGKSQLPGIVPTRVAEILARRRDWWGGPLLSGELAELSGDLGAATAGYLRAVELGNSQPNLIRRLVGLLNQRQEFDQIDHVVQILQERGIALEDLASLAALSALRKQDLERGIALARQAFPTTSTRATDHLALGRILLTAGRTEEGGKELRRAVELGPGLPDACLEYIQHLVRTGQIEQAKTAVEAAGRSLPADRAAVTLAQCWALLGDPRQAEALFAAAVAAQPNVPATLRPAAGFYVEQRQYERAELLLSKLVDPKTSASPAEVAWAKRTRGLIGLAAGRAAGVEQALGLIEQNLKANPYDFEDRRLRAALLAVRTSRRPEAIRELESLDRSKPLGAEERFLLACLYSAEGQPERYRAAMLEVLAGREKNPRHLAQFIGFLIGRHELDQAQRRLGELRSQQPTSFTTLELEARLLKAGKRDKDLLALLQARARQHPEQLGAVARLLEEFGFAGPAEEAYRADIARAPNQSELALPLARFLARQDRTDEAIAILRKAWPSSDPERVALTALEAYDRPSADQGQKSQIEAWVVEAIQKRPEGGELLSKLAGIRLRQGRYDEAETLFRQALARDADNPQALNDLAWMLSQRHPGDSQEALQLVSRAIDIAGEDWTRLDTRAMVSLQLGQVDRALEDLGRALSLTPSSKDLYFHLARAYLMTKNRAESRTALQRAEELGLKRETVDPLERAVYLQLRQELDFH